MWSTHGTRLHCICRTTTLRCSFSIRPWSRRLCRLEAVLLPVCFFFFLWCDDLQFLHLSLHKRKTDVSRFFLFCDLDCFRAVCFRILDCYLWISCWWMDFLPKIAFWVPVNAPGVLFPVHIFSEFKVCYLTNSGIAFSLTWNLTMDMQWVSNIVSLPDWSFRDFCFIIWMLCYCRHIHYQWLMVRMFSLLCWTMDLEWWR